MNTYKINFEYLIPEFSEITLDAETPEQAEENALEKLEALYPEATDITVTMISKL